MQRRVDFTVRAPNVLMLLPDGPAELPSPLPTSDGCPYLSASPCRPPDLRPAERGLFVYFIIRITINTPRELDEPRPYLRHRILQDLMTTVFAAVKTEKHTRFIYCPNRRVASRRQYNCLWFFCWGIPFFPFSKKGRFNLSVLVHIFKVD